MKTRLFSFFSLLLFAAFTSFAEVKEVKDVETPSQAGRFLQKEIRYPIVAREYNISGTVYVTLKKNGEDKLQLEGLRFDNELLSLGVLEQIEKLEPRLARLMESETPQTFRFTFKTQ